MKTNDNKMMERMFRFAVMALAAVAISLVSVSCGGDDEESYDDGTYETGGGNSAAYQQAVGMINQFWMGSDTHGNSIWLVFSENGTVSERFSTNMAQSVYKREGTWEFCTSSYDQVRFSSNLKISEDYGSVYNVAYSDNGKKMTLYGIRETLTFTRVGDGSGGSGGDSGSSSSISYTATSVLEVYVQYTPYSSTPIVRTSTHSWYKATVNGQTRLYKSTKSPYDYIAAGRNTDSYQEGVSVGSYRYSAIETGGVSVYYHYYFN